MVVSQHPASSGNKPVVYFYDEEMTNYNYGGGNPMRPHRVRLTTNLVEGYNLTSQMRLMRPSTRTREDIMKFHADDYVDFLMSVTPENQEEYMLQMRRFNLGAVGAYRRIVVSNQSWRSSSVVVWLGGLETGWRDRPLALALARSPAHPLTRSFYARQGRPIVPCLTGCSSTFRSIRGDRSGALG